MHGLSPERQLYFSKFVSEVALLETITTCENKGNTVSQVEIKRHTSGFQLMGCYFYLIAYYL